VQGPAGPQGLQGPPGVSGHQVVSIDNIIASPGLSSGASSWYLTVCPAGKRAVGGGYEFVGGTGAQLTAIASHPSDSFATGWRVQVRNNSGGSVTTTVRVHAICAIVP
jgi:hypothetical protein